MRSRCGRQALPPKEKGPRRPLGVAETGAGARRLCCGYLVRVRTGSAEPGPGADELLCEGVAFQ